MRDEQADLDHLAAQGALIAYFGYGSLVNPATHRTPVLGYAPARLRGWRRSWVARPGGYEGQRIALLSASPDGSNGFLEGLVVFDHASSLAALDEREAGYRRVELDRHDIDGDVAIPDGCPLYVYEALNPGDRPISSAILQSYLDAVLQGYAAMHGRDAVDRFMAITDNFDTPILSDRADPLYPRAVQLSDGQRAHIDAVTASLAWIDELRLLPNF
ncbi:MAG: gamma-glutamylcyclotransferase family protein [Pseudomonadota bacterium]